MRSRAKVGFANCSVSTYNDRSMVVQAHSTRAFDALIRRVEDLPANREHSDKTWVLQLMRRLERMTREAHLLPGRGPHGPVRRGV